MYRGHSEFCEQISYLHSCLHYSLNYNFMKCSIMKFKGIFALRFYPVFSYQKYSPRPLIRTLHFLNILVSSNSTRYSNSKLIRTQSECAKIFFYLKGLSREMEGGLKVISVNLSWKGLLTRWKKRLKVKQLPRNP